MDTVRFSKFRSLLWPIHQHELKKLLPMLVMFFCVSLNYSLLRNIKDAILIQAAKVPGAEVLPYIKFWGVTPAAILFMIGYAKLSNLVEKRTLFHVTILFFMAFFAIFCLFLYPNSEVLHPASLEVSFLPKAFTEVMRLWSFSLFYIFSELWGSVALSLLFWQFANQTTRVSEAKRFYSIFGIGANVALIASGEAINKLDAVRKVLDFAPQEGMYFNLKWLTAIFMVAAVATMAIYHWINSYVLTDKRFYDPQIQTAKKKVKLKLGFTDSITMLFSSKYLMCIALMVICYGIGINLVEVTWKSFIKVQCPDPSEHLKFMGNFSIYTGVATIIMMLFVSGNVLRKFGWTVAALITPIVLLVLGLSFFNVVIFGEQLSTLLSRWDIGVVTLAVFIGTIQNVASKSTKYSLFDPTKEMLYIPLDEEAKVKGKAAIDVVGGRLGKAGGSLIQQGLFGIGPLMLVLPYVEVIFVAIMALWVFSALSLGKSFRKNETDPPEGRGSCISS